MKAQEWSGQNPEYKKLHKEFEGTLRENLKRRFDRFAILHRWNFADPNAMSSSASKAFSSKEPRFPEAIQQALINDLFVPEDFEELVRGSGFRKRIGR